MAFTKGVSGNPDGRPKGSPNKTTGQLREAITNFLEQGFDQVVKDFKVLEPKDRIKVYTDLLQYGLPRLQAVSNSLKFEDLTDEQLDEIINRLKSGTYE